MLKILNKILRAFISSREERRLRRSFDVPFIAGMGRDSFRYYENGRYVIIYAEMMLGPVARRIYPGNLKWSDTGEMLTDSESSKILSELCKYLDERNIKWEFFDPKKSEPPRANH